ncbi:DNA-binding transcriptional regulator, ArsR family [Prauserella aidingensis]|uniref:ArsR/SmtB family transcription factor n=1 Tax=Prauserella aidingensis TaxID=387890 RepID=UPI0020A2351B|nr:metalloregulator ArsR/SmtB family transcription factor [Prauserella aidingensis]MCP2255152.1 DNA-binding transcriptional regulator, ArsR family [Prauserella aidingensis]
MEDDLVFKALADRTRRLLLDTLFERDGRSLGELEEVVNQHTEMSRYGVSKHLRLLVEADLVTVRKSGRERLHHLNAVPIRLIHDRWIDKYTEPHIRALTDLKALAETETPAEREGHDDG